MDGCAKRTVALCKEAGVTLTGAGATFPYGKDPNDRNIRVAPTYPPLDELKIAAELFCLCAGIGRLREAPRRKKRKKIKTKAAFPQKEGGFFLQRKEGRVSV